jgi:hypothetical protein
MNKIPMELLILFDISTHVEEALELLLHFGHWAHDDVDDAAARAGDGSEYHGLRNVLRGGKTCGQWVKRCCFAWQQCDV